MTLTPKPFTEDEEQAARDFLARTPVLSETLSHRLLATLDATRTRLAEVERERDEVRIRFQRETLRTSSFAQFLRELCAWFEAGDGALVGPPRRRREWLNRVKELLGEPVNKSAIEIERDSLRERITALEAGLRKYGRHTQDCEYPSQPRSTCSCGLASLLSSSAGRETGGTNG